MIDTRLILLEGLPGTGKTTNSDFVRIQLERNGYKANWIHEVSRPHPTSFFDEAGLTHAEYENFLKAYPETAQIFSLDNVAVFRKSTVEIDLLEIEWNYLSSIGEHVYQALRKFDTWNFPLDKYKEAALEKWAHFTEKALSNENGIYILDSSIFQFQIFSFLFENEPYTRLQNFVRKLFDIIQPLNPCLIYFYRDNTEETIDYLEKDRGTGYFEWIWNRDKAQPYYQDKPNGTEGFKQFLRDYAEFAQLLFSSLNCEKLSVEISKADWVRYESEMLSFLGIENMPSPKFLPPNGVYINGELDYRITIDGLITTDPDGNQRKLTPKSENEFYVERLPTFFRFENSSDIVLTGQQIGARWTTTGMIYKKSEKI